MLQKIPKLVLRFLVLLRGIIYYILETIDNMADAHPLQHTWVIWQHERNNDNKDENKEELCEFSSVEDFWKAWNFTPKPSEIFYDGFSRKEEAGRYVGSLSLYKKGVNPDSRAASGNIRLTFSKPMSVELLDLFWENGVLGLIGETIDELNDINGYTIIDHSIKGDVTHFSVELSMKTPSDAAVVDRVKERWWKVLSDGVIRNVCKPTMSGIQQIQ